MHLIMKGVIRLYFEFDEAGLGSIGQPQILIDHGVGDTPLILKINLPVSTTTKTNLQFLIMLGLQSIKTVRIVGSLYRICSKCRHTTLLYTHYQQQNYQKTSINSTHHFLFKIYQASGFLSGKIGYIKFHGVIQIYHLVIEERMKIIRQKEANYCLTERLVSGAINKVLDNGASQLYDKYINMKLPNHLTNPVNNSIKVYLQPYASQQPKIHPPATNKIHESIVKVIKVATEHHKTKNSGFLSTNHSNIMKPGKVLKNKKESALKSQRYHRKSVQLFTPNFTFKNKCDQPFLNDEQQLIWLNKQQKYNKEVQQDQLNEMRGKKIKEEKIKLQEQLKQLQQNNLPVVFDSQTCRFINLEQYKLNQMAKKKERSHKNSNIVHLQISHTQDNQGTSHKTQAKEITNFRKIITFQRCKKPKVSDFTDKEYNNHGGRQSSTIPYFQIEEGIKITQMPNKMVERPQTSKRCGTASTTHRTFRSFARQKMESSRHFMTIDLGDSNVNLRYKKDNATTAKSSHSNRKSILWTSRKQSKNHKIYKNMDLLTNFFDSEGSTIE